MQDVIIQQNEGKMKAALGKNVKVSLPKAFQTSKVQTKSLAVKGIPTDITDIEYKEFLDLNNITYAKAELLKSKKDGRVRKTYAATVSQNTLPQPKTKKTFTFTAEQRTKLVANVVIQIAQPQVCYPNPMQETH